MASLLRRDARATRQRPQRPHNGFALVVALFVLVVLTGVAITIANIAMTQNEIIRLATIRARLDLSRNASMEWLIYNLEVSANNGAMACPNLANGPARFHESGRYDTTANTGPFRAILLCDVRTFSEEIPPLRNTEMGTIQVDMETFYLGGNKNRMNRRAVADVGPAPFPIPPP